MTSFNFVSEHHRVEAFRDVILEIWRLVSEYEKIYMAETIQTFSTKYSKSERGMSNELPSIYFKIDLATCLKIP